MARMNVSDDALTKQIQAKMGYQEKVVYCKDCAFSKHNPQATERYTLKCAIHSSLVTFPTMKMSTCAESTAKARPANNGPTEPETTETEPEPETETEPETEAETEPGEDEPDTPFEPGEPQPGGPDWEGEGRR